MKIVNLYKMISFRKAAADQLKWLEENNDSRDLIDSYKEIIKDYDWHINDIQELLNASEEINQPQSV